MIAARKTVELEGESLLPLMTGERKKIRDFAYMGFYGRSWTIRTNEWSFHLDLRTGESKLFNLRNDPGEHRDLLAENPSVARDLELELRRHADQVMRARRGTQ
jgi:arylsulfatase A-like enzyme